MSECFLEPFAADRRGRPSRRARAGRRGAASHARRSARSSSERAVTAVAAGRPRERGEVGVGELREVDGLAHRGEVVDLGAVGRVVVDDDEHRQARGARASRTPAATAARRRRPARATVRRSGRAIAAPIALPSARPTHWKACGKTKPRRVGDAQVHRRPAHEGAGVHDDGALDRQQVVERDAQRARVEHAGRPGLGVGLVAPAAGGDLLRQRGRAARAARPRRGARARPAAPAAVAAASPITPSVDGPMRADRLGVEVDLGDAGVGRRQRRRGASSTGSAPAPKATTTSASPSSRAASGVAKPPEMPSANGSPANRPLATRAGGQQRAAALAERAQRRRRRRRARRRARR